VVTRPRVRRAATPPEQQWPARTDVAALAARLCGAA
jgi:hypothetical protein